ASKVLCKEGNNREGTLLDTLNKVERCIDTKPCCEQIVNFGEQHDGNEQRTDFHLNGFPDGHVMDIAHVVNGVDSSRIADQGHSPSDTALRMRPRAFTDTSLCPLSYLPMPF